MMEPARRISMMVIVGAMEGSVMYQMRWKRVAPSMSAASYIS